MKKIDYPAQINALRRENAELRKAVFWAYQLASIAGEPVEHLDNLTALSRGERRPHEWQVAGSRLLS